MDAEEAGVMDCSVQASAVNGKVYIDAANSKGAFEVPADSKALANAERRMMARNASLGSDLFQLRPGNADFSFGAASRTTCSSPRGGRKAP